MKFANKYELFEAVTSGRVETFFAKDLANGERVLLHIFEAPEKKADQPTVQWVLESFSKVAPDPAGLVVETGKYSGTTYAYLVTKLPDNAALQQWRQSYESFAAETKEVAVLAEHVPSQLPVMSKELPKPEDRPTEEIRIATPPTDFTAAFSSLPASAKPRSEANTRTDQDEVNFGSEQPAPPREPGDFTRQFFTGSHELHQPPEAADKLAEASASPNREISRNSPENQKPAKAGGRGECPAPPASGSVTASSVPSPEPGSFTALFRSDFKPEKKPPSESSGASPKPDDTNSGDFSDFFRGPFDGERPAETPIILPKALDTPQRNAPGEFTMVFGSGKGGSVPRTPFPSTTGDAAREPGSFTQLFPDTNQPASAPPTNASLPNWEPTRPKSEIPPPPKEATWASPAAVPPSIKPNFDQPMVSSTLREPESSLPDGATHVFSTPAAGPLPTQLPLAAGPSEYTRIISRGMAGPSPVDALVGGGPPGFKMPPAPGVPPAPKIAIPPPPKFSPPAPNAPQLETKAPKPKASYLPLVIILNVLLFVAILLIVYFAMKR